MDALKRIVRNYNNDMNKLRFVDMTYYILRKDGGSCWRLTVERYSETRVDRGARRYEARGRDGLFVGRISMSPPPRKFRWS